MTLKELAALLKTAQEDLKAFLASKTTEDGLSMNEMDIQTFDQKNASVMEAGKKFDAMKAVEEASKAASLAVAGYGQIERPVFPGGGSDQRSNNDSFGFREFEPAQQMVQRAFDHPAEVGYNRRGGKSFQPRYGRSAEEQAYRFAHWFMAGPCGNLNSRSYCQKKGIEIKVMQDNINASSGYLVPEEFEADLIILREKFGIFRKFAKISKMKSDTKSVPRRTGGVTAYPIGEGATITTSDKGWDRVGLTARKWGVLCVYTSELDEDAAIDIGDDLAEEIAYAFSKKEDDCGFNGDGTSAYHGIVGVRGKFAALIAQTAGGNTYPSVAGLTVAGATGGWSAFTLADFNFMIGTLPEFADTEFAAWYCHKKFYNSVMERLMLAAGGVTAAEVAAGRRQPIFMGYPVHVSQIMPNATAANQIPCVFGDLGMGSLFGDRRMTTIALSNAPGFANDEMYIRGTERFDINVHDVGNQSATASLQQPGPIVALQTGAS